MRKGDGRQRRMEVARNDLLIVETHNRQITGNTHIALPQGVVQAHGHTVVVTAHPGDARGEKRVNACEAPFLVRLGLKDEAGVEGHSGLLQSRLVPGETARARRRVGGGVDHGDPGVPCIEEHLRGGPPAGELVGHDGVRRRVLVLLEAIDQDAASLAQRLRLRHSAVVPAGVEDASDVVLEHHGDGALLRLRIALGVRHEEDMAVLPRLFLSTVNDLPGEGRRGDGIGHQPDEGARPLNQGLRQGIGAVSQLVDGPEHSLTGLLTNPRPGLLVDDMRDRRDRHSGALRDLLHRDPRVALTHAHAVSPLRGAALQTIDHGLVQGQEYQKQRGDRD